MAFKFDSGKHPGRFHTFVVHLEGILHAPQVATKLVALCAFDPNGLNIWGWGS